MRKGRGFTLIEVLVVAAIVAVMAALVIVNSRNIRENTRNIARKSDVFQYLKALQLYYNTNGGYPRFAGDTSSVCLGSGYPNGKCWTGAISENVFLNNALRPYFSALPAGDSKSCLGVMGNSVNFRGYIHKIDAAGTFCAANTPQILVVVENYKNRIATSEICKPGIFYPAIISNCAYCLFCAEYK